MGNDANPQRELRLPAALVESAERLIQGTKFASVEELLSFVLRELTLEEGQRLDEREQKVIEQRLRDLGYL